MAANSTANSSANPPTTTMAAAVAAAFLAPAEETAPQPAWDSQPQPTGDLQVVARPPSTTPSPPSMAIPKASRRTSRVSAPARWGPAASSWASGGGQRATWLAAIPGAAWAFGRPTAPYPAACASAGGLHGDGGAGAGGCLNGMFRPCINDRERDRRRLSAEIVASFSQAASIA